MNRMPPRPPPGLLRFGCCGSMINPATDPVGIEIVEELASQGFDYIELSLRDLAALPEPALTALVARVRATGLICEVCNNFFPPEIRLTGRAANFPAALRYARHALAVAARLGVSVVVFGSAGARNVPARFSHAEAWTQLRSLLMALGPLAQLEGITLAIEHLQRGESNILNTVAESWRMEQEVAHPNVRLLVDSYHLLQENEDPAILTRAVSAIAHVHVARGRDRVFPDEPDAALSAFFAALVAGGYDGRCSIEANTRNFSAEAPRALQLCCDLALPNPVEPAAMRSELTTKNTK